MYGITDCSMVPQKPITFDTIVVKDMNGNPIGNSWTLYNHPECCNSTTTSPSPDKVTIQFGGGGPSPPTPPTPPPPGGGYVQIDPGTNDYCTDTPLHQDGPQG